MIYKEGTLQMIIENPVMTSNSGIHLPDGKIVTTLRQRETIDFHHDKVEFGKLDKIIMLMKVERIGLITPNQCVKRGAE